MNTEPRFNRFNGVIAILAGLLLLGAEVAYAFFSSENVADMTVADRISGYLFLAGALSLTYTVVALSAYHRDTAGWFTLGAFFIATLGSALMVTSDWTEVFGIPFFVDNGITEPGGTLMIGYMINFITYSLGWTLSAIAMLRDNRVPRFAAASILLGILLVWGLGDLASTYRVLDFISWFFWYGAFVWIGWSMLGSDQKHDAEILVEAVAVPA